jgi:cholesterol transport system auxiliary component
MRRSLLVSFIAATMAASLGGCVSLLPKTSPAQLYRFGADASATAMAPDQPQSAAGKTGVVLSTISFPRASTSDGILTATGDETAYLAGVRWVAPARVLFEEAVRRKFEQRARQAQILDVGDVGSAGAILRIDVTTFEARYRRSGGDPAVTVALSARLTRSDGRVLDQRDFSATKPAGGDRVAAIVTAFDQATDQVLTAVTGWTDSAIASIPASAPQAVVSTTTSTSSSSTTTVQQPQ